MKLADIIETFISGDWGEETVAEDTPNSVFCIRGADIVPITNHCFNGIPQRFVCDKTIENKTLKAGDLIIEKSGGSPTQSTGRIVYVSEDLIKAKGNVVCSNFCTAFRVKTGWNPLYVYYYWQNVYNHGAFFNFEGKTTGIKNLQLDNALSAIDIEYLPLEKQDQIVASLASIDEKIKVNRQINDNLRASRAQSQTQFELCRGAAVNADISPNLQFVSLLSKGFDFFLSQKLFVKHWFSCIYKFRTYRFIKSKTEISQIP